MTAQEAINRIDLMVKECSLCHAYIKGFNEGDNYPTFNGMVDLMTTCKKALEAYAGIERALERLEEEVNKANKIYHEKVMIHDIGINATLQGNLHGYEKAIEIVKEELYGTAAAEAAQPQWKENMLQKFMRKE